MPSELSSSNDLSVNAKRHLQTRQRMRPINLSNKHRVIGSVLVATFIALLVLNSYVSKDHLSDRPGYQSVDQSVNSPVSRDQWIERLEYQSTNQANKQSLIDRKAALDNPDLTFRNYTINPLLTDRWPTPFALQSSVQSITQSNRQLDAFQAASPGRFKLLRGAVISLYTPTQPDWMRASFHDNVKNLLHPMSEHADWIIFYSIYPEDGTAEINWLLTAEFHCKEITDRTSLRSLDKSSDIYRRLRMLDYSQELSGVREYVTGEYDVHIITVPLVVDVPRYLVRNPGLLLRPDWLFCWRQNWQMSYALLSGAVFTSQILVHEILRGYDYFIKLDMDLRVTEAIRPSLFEQMASQSCIYMHSMYRDREEDCTRGASDAVRTWAALNGSVPASISSSWYHSLDYYWGNFMGGWLGWIQSPENRQLLEFLFEDESTSGYFHYRWTDQPPIVKSIGMWYNLSNAEIRGSRTGPAAICDYSYLRHNHIKHKWKPGQPEPNDEHK